MNEQAQPPEVTIAQENRGLEAQAFAALLGALKAVGFYPDGNPVRDRALASLNRHLAACGGRRDGLVHFSLHQEEAQINAVAVLQRGEEGWDFMVRLFESGLRTLTFHHEPRIEELQTLMALLARTIRGELNPTDEDLSVLLWELDLPSVSYRVIDASEEADMVTLSDAGEPAAGSVPDQSVWEGLHPLERYLASAGGLEETDLESGRMQIGEEEPARLRNLAKQENRHLRPKLLMVLAEILLVDLSDTEYERVLGLMRGYALDLLQLGRFREFNRMVLRLRERGKTLTGERARALASLYDDLTGADAAMRALSALDSQRCDDEKAAVSYLSDLSPQGLWVLLDAAAVERCGAVGTDRPGPAIQALAHSATQRPETILQDEANLTEDHLAVLARILPATISPERAQYWSKCASRLLSSALPGIRGGALRLLAAIRATDLEPKLPAILEDEDPQVRMIAAQIASELMGKRVLELLLEALLSKGFEEREYEEQACFYEALVSAAPDDVFPLLEKTLRRREWLAPRHWRIQKACALRALAHVPIHKSGALLMKFRTSRDELLAEASREALERHRTNLHGPIERAS